MSEIFLDWRFWAFIVAAINLIGIIILGLFNKYSHDKIVHNDLKHLADDIKIVIGKQETLEDKFIILSDSVSYLKGSYDMLRPLTLQKKKRKVRAKSKSSITRVAAKKAARISKVK